MTFDRSRYLPPDLTYSRYQPPSSGTPPSSPLPTPLPPSGTPPLAPGTPNTRRETYQGDFDFFTSQAQLTGRPMPRNLYYTGPQKVKGHANLYYARLRLYPPNGGLNVTIGDLDFAYDRVKDEGFDCRFYRSGVLFQLTTNYTTPDPTGNLVGIHCVPDIFGTTMWFVGSGSNVAGYKITSAADKTPAALTYAPAAAICSATRVVLGSETAAEGVLIGMIGSAARLMTDADGTLNGTSLNANTASLWGVVRTPFNKRTLLLYAGNGIFTFDAETALGTAASEVLDSVPAGGYAVHPELFSLGGGDFRAYWAWPKENNTSGALLFGSEKMCLVWSTDHEGTSPAPVNLGLPNGCLQCIAVEEQSCLVAHDGITAVVHRGDGKDNLYLFTDREADSDKHFRIRTMWHPQGSNEVYFEINKKSSPSGTGSTVRHIECLDLSTGEVHQVSVDQTLSSTGVYGVLAAGNGVWSPYTSLGGDLFTYADGSWRTLPLVPYGYDPATMLSQTAGAQTSTGNAYESTGTIEWPTTDLPGMGGWPKTIESIVVDVDMDAGGTAATAATGSVTAGGITCSLLTGYSGKPQTREAEGNGNVFYGLDVSATLTRTTADTRHTPRLRYIELGIYGYRPPLAAPNLQALESAAKAI